MRSCMIATKTHHDPRGQPMRLQDRNGLTFVLLLGQADQATMIKAMVAVEEVAAQQEF